MYTSLTEKQASTNHRHWLIQEGRLPGIVAASLWRKLGPLKVLAGAFRVTIGEKRREGYGKCVAPVEWSNGKSFKMLFIELADGLLIGKWLDKGSN